MYSAGINLLLLYFYKDDAFYAKEIWCSYKLARKSCEPLFYIYVKYNGES